MSHADAGLQDRLRDWLDARWSETFGPAPERLEIERFDKSSGKTHSQTVAPFGNLHEDIPGRLYIYPGLENKVPSEH